MVKIKTMGRSENYITAKVMRHLKKIRRLSSGDFYFQKTSDSFTSGIPDIYILYRGESLWIELKASGEAPRPLQVHTMSELSRAGSRVAWFDDHAQATNFIDDFVSRVNTTAQSLKL